jgi:hypothetical protein
MMAAVAQPHESVTLQDIPFPVLNTTPAEHCEQLIGIDYSSNVAFKFVVEGLFLIVFLVASLQVRAAPRRTSVRS